MTSGALVGGWIVRPNESKRTSDQTIYFTKFTAVPGKRAELVNILLGSLPDLEKDEPGTLSMLIIEDVNDENALYIFDRFADKKALENHANGNAAAKVLPLTVSLVQSSEGGPFKEVMGFLSKDE